MKLGGISVEELLWHSIDVEGVLKGLGTDPNRGLDEEEVRKRLEQYGYNRLKHEKRISPLTIFYNQFKNLLLLILILAVIFSALVGEIVDAAVILLIVVFCAVLGFIQEYRAERAIEALKEMLSPTIIVLREGREVEIPLEELVPGDILPLEGGDKIPADARLIEIHFLRCDQASLTGESAPVSKNLRALPENTPVSDRKNMVFTGTTVSYGRGRVVVTSTGMKTEFGKIAEEVAAIDPGKTPLEKRTDEISKWLGGICLVISGLVAGISLVRELIGGSVDFEFIIKMTMFAVALAVAAVPEALAAIVTGALALGMHAMARKNALVRKMSAVETLGCTTVICTDKTGTLTKGEMTVRRIFLNKRMVEVTGVGYTPEGEFRGSDEVNIREDKSFQLLLQGGLLCNDADINRKDDGKWSIKGDPTEGALVVAAAKAGLNIQEQRLTYPRIEEIPFSSERKLMTTVQKIDDFRYMAFMKGAPEVVLEKCSCIKEGDEIAELTPEKRAHVLETNGEMAQDALRVLAVAYRELGSDSPLVEEQIERDMVFLGLIGMIDPPREEAVEAVRTCKKVHIKPIMITGDHKLTAVAIARELAIYKDGDLVLSGEELDKMTDEHFEGIVEKVTVYARVSPMDKLRIVRAWKARGEIVAMTGDGVNDSPALKHADIGIAMGITGTDVAKEASDMILSDDNFATIVTAIERGRWIYDNIKKYLAYLLQCNITEVVVIGGIALIMGLDFLPLLPAAILYINLATDGLPALALGVAPPDHDIMERPPRDPKESIFGWDVKSFILRAVLIECPFFYLLFFHDLSDIAHARTEIFFLFIIVEFVIAINCRSLIYSVFKAPPHKWLLITLGWELALIAVLIQIPSVREVFGIIKPSFSDLGIIIGFALVVFAIVETTKVILRKKVPAGRKITS
ncbi:MAG: ATPase [Deltaproteobacteria bacterium CG2_30_43_15]|nr:MAG: ATPase [Deltaproteobacteria bacterium CG2_30_43_15]